jgi:RNA polymerase sigma factor (sigma-70 family)
MAPTGLPSPDHPADLVARVRAGDEAALEAIFRAYATPLCGFAVRYLRSADLAADLVQDLFLWIWRNRSDWTIQTGLKAYLYRAVRNRALDAVRHHQIERRWAEQTVREAPVCATRGSQRPDIDPQRVGAILVVASAGQTSS